MKAAAFGGESETLVKSVLCWAAWTPLAAFTMAAWRDMGACPPDLAAALFLRDALLLALLAAAAATDLRNRIIPDSIPLGIAVLSGVFIPVVAVLGGPGIPLQAMRAATGLIAFGGGLLAFTLAYEAIRGRGAIGGGDVKLFAALGFALGWRGGVALLFLSCLLFALYMGVWSLRLRPRGERPEHAGPFAPSIAAAVYVLLLCA